jgi:hypothetical protein
MRNFTITTAILALAVTSFNVSTAFAATDPLSALFTTPPTQSTTTNTPPANTTTQPVNTTTTKTTTPTPNKTNTALPIVENVTTEIGANSITISWGKVTGADNYTVYYGEKSAQGGEYENAIVAGDVTTYEIKNLQAGATYYLAVTAENKANQIGSKFYSKELTASLPVAEAITTQKPTEGLHGSAPKVAKLPQSGPEALVMILAALGGAYALRRK